MPSAPAPYAIINTFDITDRGAVIGSITERSVGQAYIVQVTGRDIPLVTATACEEWLLYRRQKIEKEAYWLKGIGCSDIADRAVLSLQ